MLKLVIGGPGSGKTEKIVSLIKDDLTDGKRVLLIVPEQDALSSERRITEAMPASKNLLNLEISNFRRLPNIVFRALGGISSKKIDKSGLCVIMWRVLLELSDTLCYFNNVKNLDAGLINDLIALFSEFSDYNITPEKLENAALYLKGPLKKKITDLAMIYDRYLVLRCGNYLDSSDEIRKACGMLSENNIFADTSLYIDSFTGFTPCEFDLLKVLIKNTKQSAIVLCIDSQRDTDIFANVIDTKRKLCEYAKSISLPTEEIVCHRPDRAQDLEFFAKYSFDYSRSFENIPKCENIDIYNCSDVFSECELLSADIAREIRGGLRYRDIRIVAGSLADYEGVLEPILKKHNIPCHFTEREDICSHPIIKYLVSALNVISYNYQIDDVMNLLKSGFAPVSEEESYMLEEYISLWGLKGRAWKTKKAWTLNPLGMTEKTSEEAEEKLEKINSVRFRITDIITSLEKSLKKDKSAFSAVRCVYDFLSSCIEYEKLDKEDASVWNTFVSVLEQIAFCAPENEIDTPQTLKKLIKLCVSAATYSQIPAAIDEIGCFSSNSMRGGFCKKVYLIGVNEGLFPPKAPGGGILFNAEKDILRSECKINLSGIADELETEGLFNLYRSVLCADLRVWISYCTSGINNKEMYASVGVNDIKKLFSDNISEKSYADFNKSDLVYDVPSANEHSGDNDNSIKNAAIEFLSASNYDYLTEIKEPLSVGECTIDASENKQNTNVSSSKLDSYVRCPFMYELENELKLKENKKIEYDPRDIGNYLHFLFEKLLNEYKDDIKSGTLPEADEIDRSIERILNDYISSICNDLTLVPARLKAMFDRLKIKSKLFAECFFREFEATDFKPVLFEFPIGRDDGGIAPYIIEYDDGTTVTVKGTIDRVDTFEKDGRLYFRIVDYKTGSKSFDPDELKNGINLQMFLYLFSIAEDEEKFKKILGSECEAVPAGVIYFMAKYAPLSQKNIMDDGAAKNQIIRNIKRYGMISDEADVWDAMYDESYPVTLPYPIRTKSKDTDKYFFNNKKLSEMKDDIIEAIKEIVDGINSGNVSAVPYDKDNCTFCRFKPVCRKNEENAEDE